MKRLPLFLIVLGPLVTVAIGLWVTRQRSAHETQSLPAGVLRGANVLLVTIDTLRADHVGAYGSSGALTPAIDSLAKDGLRFERTYAHVPLTLPSHTTIMTGTYPFTNGVRDNGSFRFDGARPTLAGTLKQAGYRTGAFVGAFPVDARFGLNAGFDVYDDRYGSRPVGGELSVLERTAEQVLAPAYDWIVGRPSTAISSARGPREHSESSSGAARASGGGVPASSEKWFAWIHLYDPHDPYEPPEPYRSRYASEPYDGEVAYTDASLGAFLAKLRSASALDNTLVVIASDHGESLGEHGERTHGLFAYDATIRVPLIMWAPRHIQAGVFRDPARLIDIMPTVLDLVGVSAPAAVDGRSLRPYVAGERTYDDGGTYFEALNANLTRNWAPLRGLVQNGLKLIDLPVPELYELGADPGEQRNVYARRTDAAKALERRLDELTANRAAPNPEHVDADTERRLRSLGYVVGPTSQRARTFTARDDPKNLIGLQNRLDEALEALRSGHPDRAEQLLKQILAERADFTVAYERLAFVYHETGRLPEGIATLETAARGGATDAMTMTTLGGYLQEAGQLDRSAAVLEAALKLNPAETDAHEKLGVTYTRMQKFGEAQREFEQVLEVDPSSAVTYNNLGSMLLASNRNDEAINALSRAVELDPGLANAHNGLGVAYARRGDLPRAAEEWRTALELRPDLRDARDNLARIGASK